MQRRDPETGAAMKIYLLMLLIGALLTAIHFTAPAEGQQKPAQQ
jgi:hypothetical protein